MQRVNTIKAKTVHPMSELQESDRNPSITKSGDAFVIGIKNHIQTQLPKAFLKLNDSMDYKSQLFVILSIN